MKTTGVKQSIVTRVRLAFFFVAAFSGAIVWKVTRIQFAQGEQWKQKVRARTISYQPVPATRGNIYSDNESILATSLPFFRVAWDPSIVDEEVFDKNVDSLAWHLAHFFGDKPQEAYRRKLVNARHGQGKVKYLRLNAQQIDYQQKKMIARWPIFRAGQHRGGVIFEKVDRRFLPFGSLAGRTIGYVSEGNSGAGIEYTFNSHLAGRDGEALFERIAGGWRPIFDGTEVKPVAGYDIKTTLDINLQDVAENALRKALIDNGAAYGTVVLMEVKTGQIKAMANLGRKHEDEYVEDYNYACADQGLTEPGSTFKLASMMALLDDNPKMTLHDTVNTGNGSMYVGGAVKTDTHGHGRISVQQVFELSSNIGVAKLVWNQFKDDPQRYIDHLHSFGLNSRVGLQLGGEAQPFVKGTKNRSWSKTSLTTMSIGYEVRLAPIHTLALYNAVANNGVKVRPYIIKEIRQADKVVQHFNPVVLNKQICSAETVKKLRLMMEGVVERGTGDAVKSPDYQVAGKTGTAWKIKGGRYVKQYSASFVGYFPADDPKYSCIVLIDSPSKGKIYGGAVAAPVFRELADKAYALDPARQAQLAGHTPDTTRQLLPQVQAGQQDELALVCDRLAISNHQLREPDAWVQARPESSATRRRAVQWQARAVRANRMPNLTGLTRRDALFLLGNAGLIVNAVGQGRVVGQSVEAGAPVLRGQAVTLTLRAPMPLDSLYIAPVPRPLLASALLPPGFGTEMPLPARGRSERGGALPVAADRHGPKAGLLMADSKPVGKTPAAAKAAKKPAPKEDHKSADKPAAKSAVTGGRSDASKAEAAKKSAKKKPAESKKSAAEASRPASKVSKSTSTSTKSKSAADTPEPAKPARKAAAKPAAKRAASSSSSASHA